MNSLYCIIVTALPIRKKIVHKLKQFFAAEKDASDCIIAALLNQAGRPRAFFARTISMSKQNHLPNRKGSMCYSLGYLQMETLFN